VVEDVHKCTCIAYRLYPDRIDALQFGLGYGGLVLILDLTVPRLVRDQRCVQVNPGVVIWIGGRVCFPSQGYLDFTDIADAGDVVQAGRIGL